MTILLRVIGGICAAWVILCIFFTISLFSEGKVGEAIFSIFILELIPAAIGFYAFKFSKRFSAKEKQKQLEEQQRLAIEKEKARKEWEEFEIRAAKERAEKEKLEAEQKEKEFQEFKNKYPNHWQNILDKKLALDMTLEMVSMILGEPHNRKESVSKTKTTEKYNFHPYQNSQKKTSYKLEVTFENGLVTGWKEL